MNLTPAPSLDALADQLPELVRHPVLLPLLFDYIATFIWALSGALIAARRGYVGIGIVVIAVVSATGGGLLRDSILPGALPALLENPVYVLLALGASLLVGIAGGYVDRSMWIGPTVHFVDALAAAVYAVVGVNLAIALDVPFAGIVIIGFINATGGGLLRDVLMRRVPDLFKPGLPFGPAALLASMLFALLATQLHVHQTMAAFLTISIVSILDLAMLRSHIRSRPLETFRAYWESRD